MQKKTRIGLSALVCAAIFPFALSVTASADQIPFGIDCMIHDAHGALLKDLGMVGSMMDGSYMASRTFSYGDLSVEATLQGPDASTPEVSSPEQIKLSFIKTAKGAVTASVTAYVTSDVNVALFEPNENLYLHCDRMQM